ncbi:MAG TPA: HAMP domain-containing sensor histidine kinase [Trebonia sp.]|nr:HAMP domain-containing sensor histidine kinase [Trebonia sp.]
MTKGRRPGWRGWRVGLGRGLSLRARLLIGLIALTAVFLVVMGVVSTLVLSTLEQDDLDSSLKLLVQQSAPQVAKGPDGFAAAYISLRTGQYGELTPDSATGQELSQFLGTLAGETDRQARASLRDLGASEQPGNLSPPGSPTLRTAWRAVYVKTRAAGVVKGTGIVLPLGWNVILVGQSPGDIGTHVRGLVLAELITGGALLAILVVCGNWLIGRGLAPLDSMASRAGLITSSGDLAARMPDPGDHRETGRLAAAINTMLDRIQLAFDALLHSEQRVRQFAADASHELRTPLTTIRGYAELYRQGALGPGELPNAMRRIEQEADRMSMLVAELLELARLDRTSSLDLTETDLAALARDAVADARAVEPDRPVTAEAPSSLVVIADESRIRQVLANLLGNVRAHTPPATPAAVRLREDRGGAVLEVADAGPGMAEQEAARAFDRFYRGARGSEPSGDGTGSGLGLSIVQAIAAAHGGEASLRAAPGAGTTVRLWIPGNPGAPRPPSADEPRPPA